MTQFNRHFKKTRGQNGQQQSDNNKKDGNIIPDLNNVYKDNSLKKFKWKEYKVYHFVKVACNTEEI